MSLFYVCLQIFLFVFGFQKFEYFFVFCISWVSSIFSLIYIINFGRGLAVISSGISPNFLYLYSLWDFNCICVRTFDIVLQLLSVLLSFNSFFPLSFFQFE